MVTVAGQVIKAEAEVVVLAAVLVATAVVVVEELVLAAEANKCSSSSVSRSN